MVSLLCVQAICVISRGFWRAGDATLPSVNSCIVMSLFCRNMQQQKAQYGECTLFHKYNCYWAFWGASSVSNQLSRD